MCIRDRYHLVRHQEFEHQPQELSKRRAEYNCWSLQFGVLKFDLQVINDIPQASAHFRHLKKRDAMRVVKTRTNSWATSHRMHGAFLLTCSFGCQEELESMPRFEPEPANLFDLN